MGKRRKASLFNRVPASTAYFSKGRRLLACANEMARSAEKREASRAMLRVRLISCGPRSWPATNGRGRGDLVGQTNRARIASDIARLAKGKTHVLFIFRGAATL